MTDREKYQSPVDLIDGVLSLIPRVQADTLMALREARVAAVHNGEDWETANRDVQPLLRKFPRALAHWQYYRQLGRGLTVDIVIEAASAVFSDENRVVEATSGENCGSGYIVWTEISRWVSVSELVDFAERIGVDPAYIQVDGNDGYGVVLSVERECGVSNGLEAR